MTPSSRMKGSLCSEPRIPAAPKPEPNSTPLHGGDGKQGGGQLAFQPLEHRAAQPGGQAGDHALHHTAHRVPASRARRISARILSPAFSSKTGKGALHRQQGVPRLSQGEKGRSSTWAMERIWAATAIPCRASSWAQIPPAMHRGAVSRPEKWPPPRTS